MGEDSGIVGQVPARARAWGVVRFVGGAVLGSYPHIAYDAFLRRLGDDAGVVVVATPYELGVDHGAIAEVPIVPRRRVEPSGGEEGYDTATMPVFAAGHSLGCKLQLIAACGDGDGGTKRWRLFVGREPGTSSCRSTTPQPPTLSGCWRSSRGSS